jgi:hypothetical protein
VRDLLDRDPMMLRGASWYGAVWLALLAGCSSTVIGTGADGGAEAAVDGAAATTCACPAGRCAVGQRWTAADGCNTCVCGSDGQGACTLLGCVPPDAGPVERTCDANNDCAANEVCEFAQGCATMHGRCVSDGCRSLPVAPQYCGCEGATLQQSSACLPDQPWRSMGACPDAGR